MFKYFFTVEKLERQERKKEIAKQKHFTSLHYIKVGFSFRKKSEVTKAFSANNSSAVRTAERGCSVPSAVMDHD